MYRKGHTFYFTGKEINEMILSTVKFEDADFGTHSLQFNEYRGWMPFDDIRVYNGETTGSMFYWKFDHFYNDKEYSEEEVKRFLTKLNTAIYFLAKYANYYTKTGKYSTHYHDKHYGYSIADEGGELMFVTR